MALEDAVSAVLTDDAGVRSIARTQGLTPRGTLAFLVQALEEGKLSFEGYLDALEPLAEAGFRLGAALYARAVRRGRAIVEADGGLERSHHVPFGVHRSFVGGTWFLRAPYR